MLHTKRMLAMLTLAMAPLTTLHCKTKTMTVNCASAQECIINYNKATDVAWPNTILCKGFTNNPCNGQGEPPVRVIANGAPDLSMDRKTLVLRLLGQETATRNKTLQDVILKRITCNQTGTWTESDATYSTAYTCKSSSRGRYGGIR
jgi:hypothetical protein